MNSFDLHSDHDVGSDPQTLLQSGMRAIEFGRIWDAQKCFETAIASARSSGIPTVQYVAFTAARAFFDVGRPAKGFAFYRMLVERTGGSTEAKTSLGLTAIDWIKCITAVSDEARGDTIAALVDVETKRAQGRWRLAETLAGALQHFRNAKVYQITEGAQRGIRIDIFTNRMIADRLSRGGLPAFDNPRAIHIEVAGSIQTLQVLEADYMTTQDFSGGNFQGCNFGDHNSVVNYFGAVDGLSRVDEDTRTRLREARSAIEGLILSAEDKADLVEQLKNLTTELDSPKREPERLKRFWTRIEEVAPTVASLLASAASLAKLLGLS